jgi:hypothetical protein
MLEGVQSRSVAGPNLRMRCSVCDMLTNATSFQYGERLTLFHLVPLSPWTETNYVQCETCRQQFVSSIRVGDLPGYDPDTLGSLLIRRVGLVPCALALLALLLSPLPLIGLLLGGIALAVNWRRPRHWTRTISSVALVLACLTSIALLLLFAIAAILDR